MKEPCIRDIEQPTVALVEAGKKGAPDITASGFVTFAKGTEYDLDKIKFHYDKNQDSAIREDLRKTSFKAPAQPGTGGKRK